MDEKGSSEQARLDIEKSVAKFGEIDVKLLFCHSAPLRVSDQDRTARLVIGTSRTRSAVPSRERAEVLHVSTNESP